MRSELNYVSVTTLHHSILFELGSAPFDDLVATENDGATVCYDFDTFRRLYNDAVESMRHYHDLTVEYYNLAEEYRNECTKLEHKLRELTDENSQ